MCRFSHLLFELQIIDRRKMFGIEYELVKWFTLKGERKECWVPSEGLSVNASAFSMPDFTEVSDPDNLELQESCNTSKEKHVSRVKTAGVNIVTFPCGQILSVDPLFGSESLSQVLLPLHALMKEPSLKRDVKILVHDNACKFAAFVKNRQDKSEIMKHLSSLDMRVDRHHFKNHVGDKCKRLHDPDKCDLLKVNLSVTCSSWFS